MAEASISSSDAPPSWQRARARWSATRVMSFGFTAMAAGFLFVMLGLFLWQSLPVWRHAGPGYLTGTKWFYRQQQFGMAPMIYGTLSVSRSEERRVGEE